MIAVCLFGFVGCTTPNPDEKKRAQLHLEMGTNYLGSGNYPAAMAELLKAEKFDANNPVIQNNLGLAFYVRQRFRDAEERFEKALRLEPKYTDARNNLARALMDQKKYGPAIEQLNIAAEDLTYPQPEKTFANLGLAYFEQKNFAKAKDNYFKALQLQRENCDYMNAYARTLFELKNYESAAESFDRSIRLCKSRGGDEPTYYSALSYMRLGNREQAVARLEEFKEAYPDSPFRSKVNTLIEMLK